MPSIPGGVGHPGPSPRPGGRSSATMKSRPRLRLQPLPTLCRQSKECLGDHGEINHHRNGIDDNCDGEVDSPEHMQLPRCYTGLADTLHTGTCMDGRQACVGVSSLQRFVWVRCCLHSRPVTVRTTTVMELRTRTATDGPSAAQRSIGSPALRLTWQESDERSLAPITGSLAAQA